jgi:hypothetical protein
MANPLNSKRKLNKGKLGMGAASLALLAFVVSSCAQPQTQEEPQAQEPAQTETQQDETAATDDASQDSAQLVGQRVTVRGDIGEQIDNNLIQLNAEDDPFSGEDILVVLPEGFTLPIETEAVTGEDAEGEEGRPAAAEDEAVDSTQLDEAATQSIQVTGEVRQLTEADVQELNLNLTPEQISEYEDRPLLVAETAAISPDPGELSSNPEAFYDQTVAVTGSLEELGPNTYKISGGGIGGEDILVLTSQPLDQAAQDANEVAVTGKAQQLDVAALQSQYNWDQELQQQISDDYADKPVIVVDQVYPVEEN